MEVSSSDSQYLTPEQFLNDTVVDFYMLYLKNNNLPSSKQERVYLFNSFFYHKLSQSDLGKKAGDDEGFQRLKNWTKDVNLFEKVRRYCVQHFVPSRLFWTGCRMLSVLCFPTQDFVFIPIAQNAHWSLVVLCYPCVLEDVEETRSPVILYLDSLRLHHNSCTLLCGFVFPLAMMIRRGMMSVLPLNSPDIEADQALPPLRTPAKARVEWR